MSEVSPTCDKKFQPPPHARLSAGPFSYDHWVSLFNFEGTLPPISLEGEGKHEYTWKCLVNRSMVWSGHDYPKGPVEQLGVSTVQRPELHLDWCSWMCLHKRGLSCTWTYLDNRSLCCLLLKTQQRHVLHPGCNQLNRGLSCTCTRLDHRSPEVCSLRDKPNSVNRKS
jgi:hypothetical protein